MTPCPQLNDINPTLAPLAFTDKGLCLIQFCGKCHLGQTSILPKAFEQFQENQVFARVNGFVHLEVFELRLKG
jgi:hypothetical protein